MNKRTRGAMGIVSLALSVIMLLCSCTTGAVTPSESENTDGTTLTEALDTFGSGYDTSVDTDADTSADTDAENTQSNWKEDGALKILTIGNSFSDDTMQYVYQIAKNVGVDNIYLGNLYIGGCSLNTHASNARADKGAYEYRTNASGTWSTVANYKMSDAIKSQKWDFISMQQASGSSGIEGTYSELGYLIGYVKALCPEATLVWNMTWAYQQNSTHSDFSKYGKNQTTMYNAILSAVSKKIKTNDDIALISPTGTAIQNARTSYVGDNLTRDGFHLTMDLGRYIAGLTFLSKLTGLSVENVTFAPEGIDDNLRKVAIESAMNAIKEPEKVTASAYLTEPAFDYSNYTPLVINWTPHGYWYSSHQTNHHTIVTGASNSKNFYASPMFTREDIPVGSVIELAEGWQYRPEAWKSTGVQSSRPAISSSSRVTVTEEWWGSYTHRAFNLSKVGSPALLGNTTEIEGALIIWIPKN